MIKSPLKTLYITFYHATQSCICILDNQFVLFVLHNLLIDAVSFKNFTGMPIHGAQANGVTIVPIPIQNMTTSFGTFGYIKGALTRIVTEK